MKSVSALIVAFAALAAAVPVVQDTTTATKHKDGLSVNSAAQTPDVSTSFSALSSKSRRGDPKDGKKDGHRSDSDSDSDSDRSDRDSDSDPDSDSDSDRDGKKKDDRRGKKKDGRRNKDRRSIYVRL